jgi:hypothetical protein
LFARLAVAAGIALAVAVALQIANRPAAGPAAPQNRGAVNVPESPAIDPAPWLTAFPLTPLAAPVLPGKEPFARALNQALEPYRRGDYRAAASALDGVLLDHPDEPVAVLYLGISRLFMDEPQNALEILRALPASAPPELAAEAAWYSVVGIARLRDPSAAEAEARALCEGKGPAAGRACQSLDTLRAERAKQ